MPEKRCGKGGNGGVCVCSPVGFGLPVMEFDERGAMKPGDSTCPALPSLSVDSRGHMVCRTGEHVDDDTSSQHRQRDVNRLDNYKKTRLADEQPA